MEELNPGSLSDRIKMFESKSKTLPSPPRPQRTERDALQTTTLNERKSVASTVDPPAQVKVESAPVKVESAPVKVESAPVKVEHFEKPAPTQPHKLVVPKTVEGQMSLSEMLEKRAATANSQPPAQPVQPTQPTQPTQSTQPTQPSQPTQSTQSTQPTQALQPPQHPPPTILHEEPHKLTMPPTVEGQMSLTEMLQKRTVTQAGTVTTQEARHFSITQQRNDALPKKREESPRSPQVFIEDNAEETLPEPSVQPLFTANGVFLVDMGKEDVKLAFSSENPLPFHGLTNVVMCVYPDQFCFYYYDANYERYDFIVVLSICFHA